MRHEHIGTLNGPVLAFGGPYSNLQATQALFEQAKERDISEQNLICTGGCHRILWGSKCDSEFGSKIGLCCCGRQLRNSAGRWCA